MTKAQRKPKSQISIGCVKPVLCVNRLGELLLDSNVLVLVFICDKWRRKSDAVLWPPAIIFCIHSYGQARRLRSCGERTWFPSILCGKSQSCFENLFWKHHHQPRSSLLRCWCPLQSTGQSTGCLPA